MLIFLIKLFFLTVSAHSYKTYSQININKWIFSPKNNDLHKPLIYIDFWATWCAPCISSIPHTQGLEKKFRDKVLFVYISNEPEYKIKSFMTNRSLRFYAANDPLEINFKHFNIKQIPTALIINPSGKIIWRGKPGELTNKILKKLLIKYDQKKGQIKRIKMYQIEKNDITSNNTHSVNTKFSLNYQKFDYTIPFKRVVKDSQLVYQGDLKKILASLLSLQPYQIELKGEMSYWKIIFDKTYMNQPDKAAFIFLKTAGYEWQITEKELNIFELKENQTSSWLNAQLYQYAESPDQTLSITDDYFLTVDNASPFQLAQTLSEKTPWLFTYNGNIIQTYDWNIRIDSLDNLLKNLVEDLDFTIKKKTENFTVYVIRKIRNK